MAEAHMNDLIRTTLDSVGAFLDTNAYIGTPIQTLTGVTVIPVSRINVGFAAGGLDYASKKSVHTQNFGGGSGGGVSIIPMAFLVIQPQGDVSVVPVRPDPIAASAAKVSAVLEQIPDLIGKIRSAFS